MIARFSFGSRRPSESARSHAPAYQVHETPRSDKVSPMVFWVCGGTGFRAGSARSLSPPAAGGMPLGWYAGWEVFTANPSGVTVPSKTPTGPSSTDLGESGRFFRAP